MKKIILSLAVLSSATAWGHGYQFYPRPADARPETQRVYDSLVLKRSECASVAGIAIVTGHTIKCIGPGQKLEGLSDLIIGPSSKESNHFAATVYNFTGGIIHFKYKNEQGKETSLGIDPGVDTGQNIDDRWTGVFDSRPWTDEEFRAGVKKADKPVTALYSKCDFDTDKGTPEGVQVDESFIDQCKKVLKRFLH